MKKIITLLSFFGMMFCAIASHTDIYDFTARIQIPQVFDNTKSLGYRKYQTQTLKGQVAIVYGEDNVFDHIEFRSLTNYTHKVSGKRFGYLCEINNEKAWPIFNVIGSNKTLKFNKSTIAFFLEALPEYVSFAGNEADNSLLVMVSGTGNMQKMKDGSVIPTRMSGYLSGTLGCGCMAYEHVSPTRYLAWWGPTQYVGDVCAAQGRWSMKLNKKLSCR